MNQTIVRKTILAAALAGGLLLPAVAHFGLAAADDSPFTGQVDLSAVATNSMATTAHAAGSSDDSTTLPSDFTPVGIAAN